jgi:hypothetical protein
MTNGKTGNPELSGIEGYLDGTRNRAYLTAAEARQEEPVGFDLFLSADNSRCVYFSWEEWNFVLDSACERGWIPQGTIGYLWEGPGFTTDLVDSNWNGTYLTDNWQEITKEDASNLADALERLLEEEVDIANSPLGVKIKDLSTMCRQGKLLIC